MHYDGVCIHVRVNRALRLRQGSDNTRKTGQSGGPRINESRLDTDPTGTFSKEIQQTLDEMHDREHLSKKAHKFLSPVDCRTARFYLLCKIHKPDNPGRPIISGNGPPIENISLFVDSFLKPLVPYIPSYIHDTPDFLRKISSIQKQVPNTAIIGTLMCPLCTPTFPKMKKLLPDLRLWLRVVTPHSPCMIQYPS